MDWDAIGAIGEVAGAIGVIVTLIYLAGQLRHNTNALRMGAASERLERDYELVLPVIESREFAEIWHKGRNNLEGLDEVDKQRLLFFERRAITLWHHVYQLRTQGLLPEASWDEQTWIMQNIGRRQAIREAWQLYKGSYDKPFQQVVEGQFSIGDSQTR